MLRMVGRDLRASLTVGVLALAACGGAPPPVAAPRLPPLGPLITLVPRGASLVAVAKPAELVADETTERVVEVLFPSEQLDRFATRTGVDPREVQELVVAIHPAGRVVLARGSFDAGLAVREAGERMAPLESSADEPFIRRAGFLGSHRVELAALDGGAVMWVDGTPDLAARVLASAREAEASRRHALDAPPLPDLCEAFAAAPFALYAPRPLELPRDTGIGMLLARERVLAVVARPGQDGALDLAAELHGEFPPGAEENFRALASSIAESDLGAALGAADALPSLRIETRSGRVVLTASVDGRVLATGLRVVLVAEIEELLGPQPDEQPRVPHAL